MESTHSPGRLQPGSSPLYRGEGGGPETKSLAHSPKAWMGRAQGFVFWRGDTFGFPGRDVRTSEDSPHPTTASLGRAPRSVSCLSALPALTLRCCAPRAGSHPLRLRFRTCIAARAAWPTAPHCASGKPCWVCYLSIDFWLAVLRR